VVGVVTGSGRDMERWRGWLIYMLFRGHVVKRGNTKRCTCLVWDGMDSPFGTAAVKLQKGRVRRLGRGVLGPGLGYGASLRSSNLLHVKTHLAAFDFDSSYRTLAGVNDTQIFPLPRRSASRSVARGCIPRQSRRLRSSLPGFSSNR
jgi:hypothetical protein